MVSSSSQPPFAGKVLGSALDAIGNTPLIRLDRLAKLHDLRCNLYGKVEFFNVGGSVKDRMALSMFEAAEKEGTIVPGKTILIEPTAGNTGAALAIMAAVKGYTVILILPQRMSTDKDVILRALGAEIVRTPDADIFNVADRLLETIPHAVMLNQFQNPNNPVAHELTTGPEIIDAIVSTVGGDRPTSGKVDVFCAGSGTGGTVTGVARAIRKSHNPDVKIIGSDPIGSVLAEPESLNDASVPIRLEGMGVKFVPPVLDRSCVSKWVKINDEEAYAATLSMHRHEGLLVGGSSGAILAGILKYLKSEEGWNEIGGIEGKNVVVMLPDGIRNYMTQSWLVDSFVNSTTHAFAAQITEALKNPQPPQAADPTLPSIASLNIEDKATPTNVDADEAGVAVP